MIATALQPDLSDDTFARIETIERDAWLDLYAAAPPGLAAKLGLEARAIDDGAILISRLLDAVQFNRLAGLGVETPARPAALDAAIAAFDTAGVRNWCVQVPKDAAELAALCAERDLAPRPAVWAKFVRNAAPARVATDLTVREIGPDEATAFGAVVAEAFGMPAFCADWFGALVGRPHWRFLMAFDGPTPAAAGAMFVDRGTAWLGIGATAKAYRGRRGHPAVMAARIAVAREAGCDLLTVETGAPQPGEPSPSFDNIREAGFAIAYLRPNYARKA